MILSDIGAYVKKQQQVSLMDIALRFDAHPDAVRGMLEVWIRKGKIKRLCTGVACDSGCDQCSPGSLEIYSWCDSVELRVTSGR